MFVSLLSVNSRLKDRGAANRRSKPFGPVTRTALCVRHGNDLNFAWQFAEDDEIGIMVQDHSARPTQIRCANRGRFPQDAECIPKFRIKPYRGRLAPDSVPFECALYLGPGSWVNLDRLHPRFLAGILASISAITSSSGIISTAPESISSRRRLISLSQAASISASGSLFSLIRRLSTSQSSSSGGNWSASSRIFCALGLIGRL